MGNFHEDYKGIETQHVPSDRAFGFTLSAILILLGLIKGFLWSWVAGGILLAAAAIFLVLSFTRLSSIGKIKNAFLKAGPFLARFLNPVLMGILFVVCFIPGGFLMRIFRHDPLQRSFDPYRPSYWQKRESHDLPDPMKYQF